MAITSIPILPPLPQPLLDAHERAHRRAAEQMQLLEPSARSVFVRYGRRLLIESLANLFLDDRHLVLRPRRRHLSEVLERRAAGVDAAFRHVDTRLAMWRMGHVSDVVGIETAAIVNALAESHDPDRRETNPGLIRATESGFHETQTAYVPPPGSDIADLMAGAIHVANDAPAPAIARAGWLCATTLAIHPFVDGNGRTARLLFVVVNSSDPTVRLDWGTIEQWTLDRSGYVSALKASQAPSVPHYDGALVDTLPFVEYACRTSIRGAEVTCERLALIDRLWGCGLEGDPADRALELAVLLDGAATLAELSDVVGEPECTQRVNELVRSRRMRWDTRGLLRLSEHHPLIEELTR